MKRSDLTEKLLDIKREKGWSWKYICEQIGGYSEVLIVGAVLGARRLDARHAAGRGPPHLSGDRADRVHDYPRRR